MIRSSPHQPDGTPYACTNCGYTVPAHQLPDQRWNIQLHRAHRTGPRECRNCYEHRRKHGTPRPHHLAARLADRDYHRLARTTRP